MFIKYGYLTRLGLIFVTNRHIIHKGRVVASPGELINIEGEVFKNYTRLLDGDEDYQTNVSGIRPAYVV